ncbi:hypothetical protein FEM48_Zijuj04G0040500 [Ziziphus jujuba var. spinosa]|uniref:DUF4005 domain-containing protein n=1 Tax=Ziziphus jujuba var. spinosa TaxID=714518 RepID=A0A978VHP7_ZIZJJ|nr:hypothetical protein FEM48_Zijuj04G0040500 [Ziziphus jujuba var. spinosa]
MGKSPGKWIKTVLFGKKSSKSSYQKKSTPPISDIVHSTSNPIGENSHSIHLPHEALDSAPSKRSTDIEKQSDPTNSAELTRQEQAAIKAQAICRGYLARRAYHALKAIIKLQALVRGHLVRRQAIATLRCMQGIVRLQACIRGRRVRQSDAVCELQKKCNLLVLSGLHATSRQDKLSSNAFICKLLASSNPIVLHLHCDQAEPNSSWSWLERWSLFHFWGPLPQLNKTLDLKSQTQKGNVKTRDLKQVERKVRVPIVNAGKSSSHPATAYDKPIHILRKSSGHQDESGKEHRQSELERVKQNLRKISAISTVAVSKSSKISDVPEKGVDKSIEKTSDPSVAVSKSSTPTKAEITPKPLAVEEKVEMLHDEHAFIEQHPKRNVEVAENKVTVDEEQNSVEEEQNSTDGKTTKDYQRSQRRSLAEKQEYPENVSQHNPTLPNYMQATKSAKAKLRGLGSPSFDPDGVENGFAVRRHSVPLYDNGKINSISPRMQSAVQASGRGESRSNKPPFSSTDFNDEGARPGWRR